jgi:hypothetical protein
MTRFVGVLPVICPSGVSAEAPGWRASVPAVFSSPGFECAEFFECLAGAECDGDQRGVRDRDRHAGLDLEEYVESAEEGAAADECDAVFDHIG